MPIYMRLTKNGVPVINGDATAKGHEKWIELLNFSLGSFVRPSHRLPSSPEKTAKTSEANITKAADSTSNRLFHATVAEGSVFKVQLDIVETGTNIISQKIFLEDAVIAAFRLSDSGRRETPTESWTLNFTKISFQ